MTKIFFIIFFGLIFSLSPCYSQQSKWEMSEHDKEISKRLSNNLYFSGGVTPFLNFLKYDVKIQENNSFSRPPHPDDFSLLSLDFGIRYNIFSYHDFFSVSIASYPSLELGIISSDINNVIKLPIGLDVNVFHGSTYNNINKVGFSIGVGRSFNFGMNNFRMQTTYIRPVIRFDKYVRKLSKKAKYASKLKSGYFGVDYSFGKTSFNYEYNSEIIGISEIRVLIGRTFNY